MSKYTNAVKKGDTYLGIELGSTRIKAVLIDKEHNVIATGGHNWENKLQNGIWTYSLEDVWVGIRGCYAQLAENVKREHDADLEKVGAMGVSAMMHGYMAFDAEGSLLVPFRTWRNTITGEAAEKLTEAFGFNIPQRWSVAHLYQAILNGESHVSDINYFTTLAGYVHWKLTGEKVLGTGDASGVFPIDDADHMYHEGMLKKFSGLVGDKNFPWTIESILPEIIPVGEKAGELTAEGAKMLDPTGTLKAGIPLCPPEGDAGTGMVATNAVRRKTGNVSAGTSVFAMVVLEKPLSKVYPEVDIVATPSGDAVAMVHCNNCLGDIDAWVGLLGEAASLLGAQFDINTLYAKLYNLALTSDAACNGMLAYNYISGEHVMGLEEGRPMFMRSPDTELKLADFMRTHLYATCASLKTGMNILLEKENVKIDGITGHGGFFKQAYVGQRIMAAALNTPVTVLETAGEGGPWGMAVLAAFSADNRGVSFPDYLSKYVFTNAEFTTVEPDPKEVEGFNGFLERFMANLSVEKEAARLFKG